MAGAHPIGACHRCGTVLDLRVDVVYCWSADPHEPFRWYCSDAHRADEMNVNKS